MTMWNWSNLEDFPPPVYQVGTYSLFAGEAVLDYFVRTGRWDAAQRFAEAVEQLRRRQKFGPRRAGRFLALGS
jgi:hypothetical protein